MQVDYRQLRSGDVAILDAMLDCFGKAFAEVATYGNNRPDDAYMNRLLSGDSFIAIAALVDGRTIGGLTAYELKKFEQPRSEIYIYDLAVDASYRRRGVATGLIEALKPVARQRGAWVIFVQADDIDEPAARLYEKLGVCEKVLHFDIPAGAE